MTPLPSVRGDEATYLDEAAAQETLAPVAEALPGQSPTKFSLWAPPPASPRGQEAACQASARPGQTVQAT